MLSELRISAPAKRLDISTALKGHTGHDGAVTGGGVDRRADLIGIQKNLGESTIGEMAKPGCVCEAVGSAEVDQLVRAAIW